MPENQLTVYLFTYDLRKENHTKEDYQRLYDFIDKFEHAKLTESFYAIRVSSTISEHALALQFKALLDQNDAFFLVKLNSVPHFQNLIDSKAFNYLLGSS